MMMSDMVDTLWVLIAAALVFLMQPGFMCLESGLTRSKNSINVAMKNMADFVFSVIGFWTVGYGLMFGLTHEGLFGLTGFMVEVGESHRLAAFFFFQVMFCGTASTIFSGAVAERMRFSAYLLVAGLLSAIVYPLFGHWAWNGLNLGNPTGWLGAAGFVDFAGSTVVHSVGGWVALATLLVIGPREGRFAGKGRPREFSGSNLPLSVMGTLLLWFGWIGFNGGSALAMDETVPRIVVYTILAGAAGATSALLAGLKLSGIPKVSYLINGSLGGLVAITACCHAVTTTSALFIGAVAGFVCLGAERLLLRLNIDDAVGAVPVHLACGIWGTLAVALFGDPILLGTGLSFPLQLLVQVKGIAAAFTIAFLLPLIVIGKINRLFPLRVSAADEELGLNFSEHGATTEMFALFNAMAHQAETSDLSIRMPVEPFTDVGLIASRYNQVMDALQHAVSHTEAIVSSARDAIITFAQDSLTVISVNPGGDRMFGYEPACLAGSQVALLFDPADFNIKKKGFLGGAPVETVGRKSCGATFPLEAMVTCAGNGKDTFYVATLRDITEQKNRERSIRQSQRRYRAFFENTGAGNTIVENDGTVLMANGEFELLSGYPRSEIEERKKFLEFFPEDERQRLTGFHRLRREDPARAPRSYEARMVDRKGRIKPVYITVSMIPGTNRSIQTILDMSELRKAQEALTKQRAYFSRLFDGSSQAIVAVGRDRRITHVNKGYEELFGYSSLAILGKFNREIVVPEERVEEVEAFSRTVLGGKTIRCETERRHRDGRLIPVSLLGFPIEVEGKFEGIFYIYEDISERKAFEKQLYQKAFHDGLTGIPNRILFMERLNRAIERRKRREAFSFAVMLIDLDRFKWVNDSLGHLAGDELLVKVSERFSDCLRAGDTVSRLGGDEFAILVEEYGKPREVIRIAQRLQENAEMPFFIENTEVRISASIGIVLNTGAYEKPEDILRDADIAMYRAKELGKARFKVFNRKLHDHASASLKLENELREATHAEELKLHYQPILSAASGKLTGFEALVRWEHPEQGLISPAKFIPIAEETGLIVPLGKWVLKEACLRMKQWQVTLPGAGNLNINVNISAKQFMQSDLVDQVRNILAETGLSPHHLKLELTESAIMENAGPSRERLSRLKAIGVKLAIDDFGTGYSSLAYLQQFPIDDLKIDRSFISGMGGGSEKMEIVKTIVALARTLDMGVVAEGVEEHSQLERLREIECDNVQGFFFSKPVARCDVAALIEKFHSESA